MVNHKMFGLGQVISREVTGGYTCVTARFDNGKELRFAIPASFETGAVEALGSLKDEVDQAIAARRARLATVTAPVSSAAPSMKTRTRTKPKTTAAGPMAAAFKKYLISRGYKLESDKGARSTVYYYLDGADLVRAEEGLSWDGLKKNISSIIPMYEAGGAKEQIGAKQHKTVINGLRRFAEFAGQP